MAFYPSQAHGNTTVYQPFCTDVKGGSSFADSALCGELHLFNVASTSQVKNWYGVSNSMQSSPGTWESHVGGYFNTTSDIDAISFKANSGNVRKGTIKMYGII